jgi:hypothetical protein
MLPIVSEPGCNVLRGDCGSFLIAKHVLLEPLSDQAFGVSCC